MICWVAIRQIETLRARGSNKCQAAAELLFLVLSELGELVTEVHFVVALQHPVVAVEERGR